jgi:hypothetical protein
MSNFKAYLSSISSKDIHPSLDCFIDLGLMLSGFDREKIAKKDDTCYYEHRPIFSHLSMDKGVINFNVS